MRQTLTGLILATILLGSLVHAGDREDALDRQLEQARKKLDHAAALLTELYRAKYGHSKKADRAMLGILLSDGPYVGGIELVGITPGSGAEAAGIKAGDRVLGLGGVSLAQAKKPMTTLVEVLESVAPGEVIAVQVERDGKVIDMDVKTQSQLDNLLSWVRPKLASLDIELSELSEQLMPASVSDSGLLAVDGELASYFGVEQGVVVVEPFEPLRGGDVLLSIDGQSADDLRLASDALSKARAAKEATLVVLRHGERITLQLN